METLIKNLKITKNTTYNEIVKKFLNTRDFSTNYYLIKSLPSDDYEEKAKFLYDYAQNNIL